MSDDEISSLRAEIQAALATHPTISTLRTLTVKAEDGIFYVTGKARSFYQKQMVGELALNLMAKAKNKSLQLKNWVEVD